MDVNLRMITKKSTFKALMTLTKAKNQSIPELSDLQVHCRIPLHRHTIRIKPQYSWFSLHQRNSGLKHTKRTLQSDTTETHQLSHSTFFFIRKSFKEEILCNHSKNVSKQKYWEKPS